MYGMSLDELTTFDIDIKEIQEMIEKTSDAVSEKTDWTAAWSKKYPVLAWYQDKVEISYYAAELQKLLRDLEKKYGYNKLDAFPVLKDILAAVWKNI
ncbi:MAG: hypothetical protein K1W13_09305 [Lachnospiraceae bacterium]